MYIPPWWTVYRGSRTSGPFSMMESRITRGSFVSGRTEIPVAIFSCQNRESPARSRKAANRVPPCNLLKACREPSVDRSRFKRLGYSEIYTKIRKSFFRSTLLCILFHCFWEQLAGNRNRRELLLSNVWKISVNLVSNGVDCGTRGVKDLALKNRLICRMQAKGRRNWMFERIFLEKDISRDARIAEIAGLWVIRLLRSYVCRAIRLLALWSTILWTSLISLENMTKRTVDDVSYWILKRLLLDWFSKKERNGIVDVCGL